MQIEIQSDSGIVARVKTDKGVFIRSALNGDPHYARAAVVWQQLAGKVGDTEIWAATKTHSDAVELETAYQEEKRKGG
jgi:hypothetical protein